MIRRLPIIPTIVVVAAAAIMVALGVWQLQRARWKEGLLAQYAAADRLPPIAFPTVPLRNDQLPLFRHATGVCLRITGQRASAGENRSGEPGYVHIVDCATGAEGPGMSVEVGWSKNPNAKVAWAGGPVSGVIAPDRLTRMRLVAASAPPGLEPSAPPSVSSIPNNHRSYAVQWFAFVAIALVIYALAVRKRLGERK
jgi:cytochrome oxidase assembly protein ShyY1